MVPFTAISITTNIFRSFPASKQSLRDFSNVCAVCLQNLWFGARRYPCGHIFHERCLVRVPRHADSTYRCPTCQCVVFPVQEGGVVEGGDQVEQLQQAPNGEGPPQEGELAEAEETLNVERTILPRIRQGMRRVWRRVKSNNQLGE